jgi:tetratricopeptide (TPR) repeat protein
MKTIDFSYFIERYNNEEMSNSEKIWFEKELEGNAKLRDEVLLRKKTDNILKNQDVISLRNKLSRIENSRTTHKRTPRFRRVLVYSSAAAIAIMILMGSSIALYERSLSVDDILKAYEKQYQPSTGQRSVQIKSNEDFDQGLEYFNTSDYKNAAFFFNKVVETNPKDMAATLLSGISNYEDTRYLEAKVSFGKVLDDNKNLYIDQAQWYLAACYIRTVENDKAIRMLEMIKNENGIYSKPARKLIKRLK